MMITWYGLSCLRIEAKTNQGEAGIITDPFDPKKVGLKLPRAFRADLVLQSQKDESLKEFVSSQKEGEDIFWIDSPGEYEKKNVFVCGSRINHAPNLIYTLEVEDLHLLFCGLLSRLPEEKALENIENIDVLFVPIGGHGVLSAKEAGELVGNLEPRIVIPIYYKLPGLKLTLEGPEGFLKAMGAKNQEPTQKLKITKKDLPQEETLTFLLTPPY